MPHGSVIELHEDGSPRRWLAPDGRTIADIDDAEVRLDLVGVHDRPILIGEPIEEHPVLGRVQSVRVVFDQGSALGTGLPRLRAGWVPHEAVFLPRGSGPFLLAYGSGSVTAAEAPLSVIPRDVIIQEAQLAAPRILGGEDRLDPQAGPFPRKASFLWAALVLGVLLLGWMAYRLSRDLNRPSHGGTPP